MSHTAGKTSSLDLPMVSVAGPPFSQTCGSAPCVFVTKWAVNATAGNAKLAYSTYFQANTSGVRIR